MKHSLVWLSDFKNGKIKVGTREVITKTLDEKEFPTIPPMKR